MSYTVFARYYDRLMHAVDYQERAGYLCAVLKKHGHDAGLVLDLACGTGSLTVELAKRGMDIYGVDASAEMLAEAQQKAAGEELSILFLRQKMQSLDLYGTVDTVFCAMDSINHLTLEKDWRAAFERVSLFLNPGGYFIFDCNTVYKHRVILADNTFVYDTGEVFWVWQNALEKRTDRVAISLDFFTKRPDGAYSRSSEHFYERAYPTETICGFLQSAGLMVEGLYADLTFQAPAAESERLLFVAKKSAAKAR